MKKNAGILILYGGGFHKDASTINEYIDAFIKCGDYKYAKLNTISGYEDNLDIFDFDALILHYSLFGSSTYLLTPKYLDYIRNFKNPKIAIFQDEGYYCNKRFDFINEFGIDAIITLMSEVDNEKFYKKYTNVKRFIYAIPGYVDESLLKSSTKYSQPRDKRCIDVSYRGRNIPYNVGDSALEKMEIGDKFEKLVKANNIALNLDISSENDDRIYGEDWHRFLGSSKAVLGIESGYTIVDIDDKLSDAYNKLISIDDSLSFEKYRSINELNFARYSSDFYYRTISPRHFEAAAFKCCQVLFEGKYSDIMKPNVHYIELKKDFSNFDDVIRQMSNASIVDGIVENAYNDLILNEKFSYKSFVKSVENLFVEFGIKNNLNREVFDIDSTKNDMELKQKNISKNKMLRDISVEKLAEKVKGEKLILVSDGHSTDRYRIKLVAMQKKGYIIGATISSYIKLASIGVSVDILIIRNSDFAPIFYLWDTTELIKINPPKNIIYLDDTFHEAVVGFGSHVQTSRFICMEDDGRYENRHMSNPCILAYITASFKPAEILLLGYEMQSQHIMEKYGEDSVLCTDFDKKYHMSLSHNDRKSLSYLKKLSERCKVTNLSEYGYYLDGAENIRFYQYLYKNGIGL